MMRTPRVFTRSFLLVVILLLVGPAHSVLTPLTHADSGAAWSVYQAVEIFCQIEFEGDQESRRYETIWYSEKEVTRRKKQRFPLPVHSFAAGSDPLFVVASYQITEVQPQGKHATAKVRYKRLVRTEDWGSLARRIIPEKNDNDLVTLNLIFENSRWWVLDPPPPRVSKQVLIEYYEGQVKDNSSMWEQKLNDPTYDEEQRANVRANRDRVTGALRILKSLP